MPENKRHKLFHLMPDSAYRKENVEHILHIGGANGIFGSSDSGFDSLAEPIRILILRLLSVHYVGTLHVNKVQGGSIELSIPDPDLLKEDGPKELNSRHLYINLTKCVAKAKPYPYVARCVKSGKVWSVNDLLSYTPLFERKDTLGWNPMDYKRILTNRLTINGGMSTTVDGELDLNAKLIEPGTIIPITDLPKDHPAVEYLLNRGYNLEKLYKQFECGYCIKENPQFKHIYGRDDDIAISSFNPIKTFTPQGRIVFFNRIDGHLTLWQARIIEQNVGNQKFYYCESGEESTVPTGWVQVAAINPITGKYEPAWNIPNKAIKKKYIIAPGAKASLNLFGFDAAVAWNKEHNTTKPIIGICEGILDAARLGPPFCAIMGASLSAGQIRLIANRFGGGILYYVPDHDEAGSAMEESISKSSLLQQNLDKIEKVAYPMEYKDVGDINDPQIVETIVNQLFIEKK